MRFFVAALDAGSLSICMAGDLNLVGFYGAEGTPLGGVASIQGAGPGATPINTNIVAIVGITAQVEGPTANGAAPGIHNPLWCGGWDGTDVRALLTSAAGRLSVDINSITGGSITANQGTPALIGNAWPTEVTDGTNVLGVAAHPFIVAGAAGALALSAQLPAALVGARLDINNGAWLGSTAPTVGQKVMASSLPIAIASDQSAVPVSGTVTANIGTTGGLALDATLTGGTQVAIARGGAKGATAAATLTSTAEGADHQALDVQLYAGSTAIGSSGAPVRIDPTGTTTQPVSQASPTPQTTTPLTPTVVNFATSGDHNILGAVALQKNRVFRLLLIIGGSCNLTFKDGATALTGPMPVQAGSAITLDFINGDPYYTTTVNTAFNINTDAAVQVSGTIWSTTAA